MPSFPWDSLRTETLRSICKIIGATSETKRNRNNMVTYLKEVETRGLPSASQDSEHTVKVVPATKPPPASSSDIQPEDSEDSDESDDMDTGDGPDSVSKPTCPCADGWLSPRMKFILSTVAAVAWDLILDTGDMAIEFGRVGAVHMAQYIPDEELPRGKKSVGQWIEGFSTICREIHKMFEAGHIPTEDALLKTLEKLPNSARKQVNTFTKHTQFEHVLSGLVKQAKTEWEDDFQDTHCDKEWKRLPVCATHDFDWILAEDALVG